MTPDLSVVIPARHEMFLTDTVEDVLAHAEANTDIVVICDGEWPLTPIAQHPKVTLVHVPTAIGQRAACNLGIRLSRAPYVMKLDAHCAVAHGFDRVLLESAQTLGPDVLQVPTQWNLHAFDWLCSGCQKRLDQGPTPRKCSCQPDATWSRVKVWGRRRKNEAYRFDRELKFGYFGDHAKRPSESGPFVTTMSLLGACWFLSRERFWQIDGLDERHGGWGQMGTELACKSWLSGGRVVTTRATWYAHMFRTQGGDFGFPYEIHGADQEFARQYSQRLWRSNGWAKQVYPLRWLVDQFWPIPGWTEADRDALPTTLDTEVAA